MYNWYKLLNLKLLKLSYQNYQRSNKYQSLFYKRDILPLLPSLSIIDLFMLFLNMLKDLIFRVLLKESC